MSTEKSIYFQISLLGFGLVELITGEEEHPLNQPNSLYGIIFYATLGLLYICSGSSNFLANLQSYIFLSKHSFGNYNTVKLQIRQKIGGTPSDIEQS